MKNEKQLTIVPVQNVQLRPEDVSVAGLYIDRRPMVITIPDVFHQLHCLVRRMGALEETLQNLIRSPESDTYGASRHRLPHSGGRKTSIARR